jgi:regulator of sigma E protease
VISTIIAIVVVLFIIISCHELGHFIVAKVNGVRIDEVGIFLPPRIFAFKRGETEYSLNMIPLGAFVRMPGREDTSSRSLASKSPWVRLVVSSAGPIANVLLAFLIFSVCFMIPTQVITGGEGVKIMRVSPGSPAEMAGIQPGDVILSVDERPIQDFDDLSDIIQTRLGEEVSILLLRDSGEVEITLIPRSNPPEGQGAVGISLSWATTHTAIRQYPPWEAITMSGKLILDTPKMLGDLIFSIRQDPSHALVGPVGAAQATGEMMKYGVSAVVVLAGSLSIGLALFNILPFPPLDGGGAVLAIIEGIRRGRRLSEKSERLLYTMGTLILLGIFVMITYNDILRLISGESVFP